MKYLVKSSTRLPAISSFPRRTPCLPNGRRADDLYSTAFHPSKPICRTNGLSISMRRSRFAGSASKGVSVRQCQVLTLAIRLEERGEGEECELWSCLYVY